MWFQLKILWFTCLWLIPAPIYYNVPEEFRKVADEAFEYYNQGLVASRAQKESEAIEFYQLAISKFPEFPQAHNNLANLLGPTNSQTWHHYEAAIRYATALGDNDTLGSALNNMGQYVLVRAGKSVSELLRSIEYFNQALIYTPASIEALYNKGNAYNAMSQYDEAVNLFSQVLALNPAHAAAHMDMGNIYFHRGETDKAIYHQNQVIQSATTIRDKVAGLNNKGQFLKDGGLVHEALETYMIALELDPSNAVSLVNAINARRQLCLWEHSDRWHQRLYRVLATQLHASQVPALLPYEALLMDQNMHWLYQLTTAHAVPWNNIGKVDDYMSAPVSFSELATEVIAHKRLKLGYLSYDYRDHPMGQLTIGALEHHDRAKFLIYGYSYGPDDHSEWRKRTIIACQKFTDVRELSYIQAAARIRDDQVHIVIDLMAHTRGTRLGIVALKPAPIIINYLGYPGTMGSAFTDYIIIDRTVVPAEQSVEQVFTEKIVYLPHAYQVNTHDYSQPLLRP